MDIRKETIYEEPEDDYKSSEEEESKEEESESSEESDGTSSTSSSSAASTSRVAVSATRVHPPAPPPTTVANTTVRPLTQCAAIGHGCDTYETPSRQSMRNRDSNRNNNDTEDDTASTSSFTSSSSSSSASTATSSSTVVKVPTQAVTTASVAVSKKSLASVDASSKSDSSSTSAEPTTTQRCNSTSQSSINTGIYQNPPCTENISPQLAFVSPPPRAVPIGMFRDPPLLHTGGEPRGVNDLPQLVAPANARAVALTAMYRDLLRQSGAELRATSDRDWTSGNDSEPNCKPVKRVATEPGRVDVTSDSLARSVTSEVSRTVRQSGKTPVGESRKFSVPATSLLCTGMFGNDGVYLTQTSQVRKEYQHSEASGISMAADNTYITNICRAAENGRDGRSAMSESSDVFGGIFEEGGAPTGGKEKGESLVEVLTNLKRCESTDDKLRVMCDKYSAMIAAQERLQLSASESERQICYLRREKDSLEKKHARVVRMRDRLKLVCQTLQQQIRELRLENMAMEGEAGEKGESREEIREKCRKEVERLTNMNEELVERLRNENEELVKRLTNEKTALVERLTKKHEELVQRLSKENADSVERLEREKESAVERLKIENEDKKSRLRKENKKVMSELRSMKDRVKKLKATVEATQTEARVRSALMLKTKAEHDEKVARLREENEILQSEVTAVAAQCANQHDDLATKRRQLEECNAALKACRKEEHYRRGKAEKYRVALGKAEKETDSWNQLWKKSHQTLLEANLKRREQRDELQEAGRKIVVLKALCKELQDDRRSMKKTIRELKTASENSRCDVKIDAATSDYRPEVKPRTGDSIGKVPADAESVCRMVTSYGDMDADVAAAKSAPAANLLPGGETLLAESVESLVSTLMTKGYMSGGKLPRERGHFPDVWGGHNVDAFVIVHVSHVDIEPALCKPDAIHSIENMAFIINENYEIIGDCTADGKVVERNTNSWMEKLKKFTFCHVHDFDIPPRKEVRFSSKVTFRSIGSGTDTTERPKNSHSSIETACSLSDGQLDDVSVRSFKSDHDDSASSRTSAKVPGEVEQEWKEPEKEDITENSLNLVDVPSDTLTYTVSLISSDAGMILKSEGPIHWEEHKNNSIETRTNTSVHEPISNNRTHYDPEQSRTIYYNSDTNTSTPEEISAMDNLVQCTTISKNEVKCSDSTPAQLTNTDSVEASPSGKYPSATSDPGEELRVLSVLPNVKESASPEAINVQQRSPAERFPSEITPNQRRPTFLTIIPNNRTVRPFSPIGNDQQQQCIASKPPIPNKRTTRPAERTVPYRTISDAPGAKKASSRKAQFDARRNASIMQHIARRRSIVTPQTTHTASRPVTAPDKKRLLPIVGNRSRSPSPTRKPITAPGPLSSQTIAECPEFTTMSRQIERSDGEEKRCQIEASSAAELQIDYAGRVEKDGTSEILCHIKYRSRKSKRTLWHAGRGPPVVDKQKSSVADHLGTNNVIVNSCPIVVYDRDVSPTGWDFLERRKTRRPSHEDAAAAAAASAASAASAAAADLRHKTACLQREQGDWCPVRKCSSLRITSIVALGDGKCLYTKNSVSATHIDWTSLDYCSSTVLPSPPPPPPPPPPPLPAPPPLSCPQKCTETGNMLRGLQSKEWFLLERDEREGERVGEVKSKIAIIGHIRWLVLESWDFSATDSCIADTDDDSAIKWYNHDDQGIAVTDVCAEGVVDESEVFGNGGTSTSSAYPNYDLHVNLVRETAELKKVKPLRSKLRSFMHKFF